MVWTIVKIASAVALFASVPIALVFGLYALLAVPLALAGALCLEFYSDLCEADHNATP